MTDLASASIPITPSLKGLQGSIQAQLGGVQGQFEAAGSKAGGGFSSGFSKVAGFGLTALKLGSAAAGAGVAALGVAGVRGAAALETTTTAFTSLLGSSAAADAQIKSLQKFAAATPFSQQDVIGYAQQFLSMAGSVGLAKDQVEPFLTTIGNLGAVTGASAPNIKNAVTAIGQIGSSGKVTLDNLNQISEAFPGFNGAAAIAAGTGKTTAQVMHDISAGSIDAKSGVAALLDGMKKFPGAAGAMDAQSKTLNGMWSTFTDTIQISLTKAITPIVPALKTTLTGVTNLLSNYLLPAFNNTVTWLITNWPKIQKTIVGSWNNYILPALKTGARYFNEYVIQPATIAVGYIVDHWPEILKAIQFVWSTIQPVLAAFGRLLMTIWHSIIEPLVAWVKAHWSEISTALQIAVGIIAVTFKVMAVIITATIDLIAGVLRVGVPIIVGIIETVITIIKAVADAITWLYSNVWKPQIDLIIAVIRGVITAAEDTYNGIMTAFNAVVDFITGVPGKVASAASGMFDGVMSAAKSVFGPIARLWNNTVGKIKFSVPSWVPEFGGKGFSFPTIDGYAKGGIIPATPGGRVIRVAEAGQSEVVAPLSKFDDMLNRAAQMGGGGGNGQATFVFGAAQTRILAQMLANESGGSSVRRSGN